MKEEATKKTSNVASEKFVKGLKRGVAALGVGLMLAGSMTNCSDNITGINNNIVDDGDGYVPTYNEFDGSTMKLAIDTDTKIIRLNFAYNFNGKNPTASNHKPPKVVFIKGGLEEKSQDPYSQTELILRSYTYTDIDYKSVEGPFAETSLYVSPGSKVIVSRYDNYKDFDFVNGYSEVIATGKLRSVADEKTNER